jgi:hypothetical protein
MMPASTLSGLPRKNPAASTPMKSSGRICLAKPQDWSRQSFKFGPADERQRGEPGRARREGRHGIIREREGQDDGRDGGEQDIRQLDLEEPPQAERPSTRRTPR